MGTSINRIISVLVLLCFLLNIPATTYGTTQTTTSYPNADKLAPAFRSDDLGGEKAADMSSIKYAIEYTLKNQLDETVLTDQGFNIDAFKKGVQSSQEISGTHKDLQFFLLEAKEIADGYYSVLCRFTRNGAPVDYYAVFSPEIDQDGGYFVGVYTKTDFEQSLENRRYVDEVKAGLGKPNASGSSTAASAPLSLMPSIAIAQYFIGMSMGGTKLEIVLYAKDPSGNVRRVDSMRIEWVEYFKLKDQNEFMNPGIVSPERLVNAVSDNVNIILTKNNLTANDLIVAGLTWAGPVDMDAGVGTLTNGPLRGDFADYPFAERLKEKSGVPFVELNHDAYSGLLGELASGQLKGCANCAYIIVGTGLGGSVAEGGKYKSDMPELTEPGHHIVGKPQYGERGELLGYKYRFIRNDSKTHPYEIVENPDPQKPHQITEAQAEEMVQKVGARLIYVNSIWAVEGERDIEDIAAGLGIVPLLKDKEQLALMFGGKSSDYSNMNKPEDLTNIATNNKASSAERSAVRKIIGYIAREIGKGLACLVAEGYGKPWQLERIVLGSTIAEKMGEGLTTEDGQDFFYFNIRSAVYSELMEHYTIGDAAYANAIAQKILRSDITQDERETAGFGRMIPSMGGVVAPPAAGLRNTAGTFLPLSQLNSVESFGIGDFGQSGRNAIDLHAELGMNVMQMLPIAISSAANSPYSVASSKSIDPIYIDIRGLFSEFGVPRATVDKFMKDNAETIKLLKNSKRVDYGKVKELKGRAFKIVWNHFDMNRYSDDLNKKLNGQFNRFIKENEGWLEDHMLYLALKEEFMGRDMGIGWDWRIWNKWDNGLSGCNPLAMAAAKRRHSGDILFRSFLQFVADRQFKALQAYAESKGVEIALDIPFALDGADIWLNQEVFGLSGKNQYKRKVTQGVPAEPAYPSGQYWQFYPYDWSSPKTIEFIMDIFEFYQKRASYVRLDHVLGYYRAFLFTEDVDNKMTLEKLGLFEKIRELQESANASGSEEDKMAAAKKAYELIKGKLREWRTSIPKELEGALDPDSIRLTINDDLSMTPDGMILIARAVRQGHDNTKEPVIEGWIRQDYVVEQAIYNRKETWDIIRTSPDGSGITEEEEWRAMYRYLFPKGKIDPVRDDDGIRLAYFKLSPGEKMMSEFLRLAQERGTTLIWETLGVVPEDIQSSVERLGGTNYTPVIWGEVSKWGDKNNPFYPDNHIANAFVTYGLHDSVTMKYRWEKELTREDKEKLLNEYLGEGKWREESIGKLTDEVRYMLLSMVMASRSRIAVLTWMDILGLGIEYRLNDPEKNSGQWEALLPITVEELLAAARNEIGSTPLARDIINMLRKLIREGKRETPKLGSEKKILNITPEVGGKVLQIREVGKAFMVDAYTQGDIENVNIVITDENGNKGRLPMLQVKIGAHSVNHGLPQEARKWTILITPKEAGTYTFHIEAAGVAGNSGTGRLIAVEKKADLNPLSPDYYLRAQEEIREMVNMAGKAGLMIPTRQGERCNLLLPADFFKNGELAAQQMLYGDRFDLNSVSGSDNKQLLANILSKSKDNESRTIALVTDDLGDEELKVLIAKGIRFIRIKRSDLLQAKDNDDNDRAKFQIDTYAVMLLARSINETIGKDSPIYRMLSFYLKTHFNLEESVAADDYINAIVHNDIAKLIKGYLILRPIEKYDAQKEYENISKALISA